MAMANFREEFEDPQNAAPPGPAGVEPPPAAEPPPPDVPPGTVPPMLAAPPPPPPPEMLARPDEQPLPPAPAAPPPPTGGPRGSAPPPPVIGADEKAAYDARDKANAGQIAAVAAGKEAAVGRGTAVSAVDSDEAKLLEKANADADKTRAAAHAHLDQAREEIKGFKERDLFEGNDAARVGAWILAGIGEFAAKRSGTTNTALQVLNQATERYTQKERARYERLVKKGEMSERDMQTAEAEIINKRIGIREMFISKREAARSKFEGPEAAAKGDEVIARLQKENAEDKAKVADVVNRRVNEQKELQIKAMTARAAVTSAGANAEQSRAAADLARANTRKVDAETGVIAAGGGVGGGGRAAGIQIQKATLAEHGSAALDVIDELHKKGVELTEADRQKIQDNVTGMKSAEHADPFTAWVGRHTVIARSAYEGLSPEKQRLANAYEILAQKGAAITSPSHAEDEMKHARTMFDMLQPGQTPEMRAQMLTNTRKVIGAAKGLGGGYTGIAQRGAEQERATRESTDAGQITAQQAAQAQQWLRDNPTDPRAAAVRQRLRAASGGR